jgi:hypothetical protein
MPPRASLIEEDDMSKGWLLRTVGMAVLAAPLSQAAEAGSACGRWESMSTPNPGHPVNALRSVATRHGQAWAVGHLELSSPDRVPLVLRWGSDTGNSGWTLEPVPFSGRDGWLNDVGIGPQHEVWVVGGSLSSRGEAPLAMRWRKDAWDVEATLGSSRGSALRGTFHGVAALAEDDVWMVGERSPAAAFAMTTPPLIAHWDGWSLRAVAGRRYALKAVSGTGPRDVWAVGSSTGAAGSRGLLLHWDGRAWSAVGSPADSLPGSALHDVVALTPDDVWAVGDAGTEAGSLAVPAPAALYLHWNGTEWARVPAPAGGTAPRAVAAAAQDEVWASSSAGHTRWDGLAWSLGSQPANKGASRTGLAVLGPCNVIAVGTQGDAAGSLTVAERLLPSPNDHDVPSPDDRDSSSLPADRKADPNDHDVPSPDDRDTSSLPADRKADPNDHDVPSPDDRDTGSRGVK